jgi:tetratricopeptide (TPR) repeat protein
MFNVALRLAILLLIGFSVRPLVAQGAASPESALLRQALMANGQHDQATIAKYEARVEGWIAALRQRIVDDDSPRDRAVVILAFLQREVLTGEFDANCSDVAETVDHGRFNCATATILLAAISRELGVAAIGIHMPGHVRVRVPTNSPLDVETTLPAAVAITQPAPDFRLLTDEALVAKLVYNRGVQRLEAKQFDAAATEFARALAADPLDAASRQNLLAALNRGAIALSKNHQYSAALDRISAALEIDPQHSATLANQRYVHQQRSLSQ